MIGNTLAIALKEFQILFKDKGSLALIFLLPLLLGGMMGGAHLSLEGDEREAAILLHVSLVNEDSGAFGTEVVRAIESIDELNVKVHGTMAEAEQRVMEGEVAAAIIIPADFSAGIDAHTPTSIAVIVDPGQPESASIVTGIMNQVVDEVTIWGEVQYGIRTLLDESGLLAGASMEQQRAAGAQAMGAIMTTLSEMRRTPAIAVVSEDLEGTQVEGTWDYIAIVFPGFAVMFIFINIGFSAPSLLTERESGTLRRLLVAPFPRGTVIAGKMVAYTVLACLQVLMLFAVARIVFDMQMGQSPVALVLLSLTAALTSAAAGMMIASLAKSAKQSNSLGVILGIVLAAIGGCIPMPGITMYRAEGFMGILSRLTPQAHALEGYYRLMIENKTLVAVLPQIGILLVFGIIFFLVARWRFRFE
jgi:ABC-2 type transport system permease protein